MLLFRKMPSVVWLLAASAVLLLAQMYPLQDWGGDFASYIMQARSLVEGSVAQFMVQNSFSIYNSSSALGPVAYPWGTPMLLAPLYAFFGSNMVVFRLAYAGLFLLLLISLYLFARSRFTAGWTLAFVALFALNRAFLDMAKSVTSDVPFALVSLWALVAMGRFYVEKKPLWGTYVDAALVGLLCFAATTFRVNGVLLLGTLLCIQAVNVLRHGHSGNALRRVGVYAIPWAVCILCAGLWGAWFPSGEGSHLAYLKHITVATLFDNFIYNIGLLGDFFVVIRTPQIKYILVGISLPLAIWGAFRHYRLYYHFILYALGTFALYTIWPFQQGARFFFPLFPPYLFFVFLSLVDLEQYALRMHRTKWLTVGRVLCGGFMILVVSVTLLSSATKWLPSKRSWLAEGERGPYSPPPQDMFQYIRENTDEDSIIVFFKPRVLSMFTGRRSVLLEKPEHFTGTYGGGYLCIYRWQDAGFGQMRFAEVQAMQEQGRLEKVYANADFDVYKIR